ncbi:DUF1993 domain-containing protein [Glacieibacterium megasporae]|uniref:DUF1993 domain-containing protein n=1 Tax=Glacieibacterium megasporae TaxID=2835787 RepID=UPI001C1DF8F4|nr:DUF1993 domain-containing protein [Polymorphobacter megasporae]UAJ11675.1 DUF1993 domain-containing protein [Polymorphobacter megasporae]
MTLSLYTATVPAFRQIVDSLAAFVAKGEAFAETNGIDPATLVNAKLAPDMLGFAYQVKSVTVHSVGAIAGVRAGEFAPDMTPPPTDFAALHALLAETSATLAAIDPAEIDGFVGGDMAFVFREHRMPYFAEDFLLSFSLPNFYFHATTAYDILRWKGVPLGKRDYIGRPRIRV